ncbi:uncharacterized protein PG986_012928 [Apiospora aurea]|uniref:Trypsin-like serine protease n=1 Tax=Apiospora aurea TaxID=335848 RepID=A0ABR1Q1E4_9PEZI
MQRYRRPDTSKWPYAADSTGVYRGLLKQKYPYWVATGPARDLFTTEIYGSLNSMLRNSLPESNSIMSLTLFMIGKAPLKTNPTIMVVSDDKPRRKEAFEKIKASRILADYPGFELGHCDFAAEHEDLRQLGTGDIPPLDFSTDAQPETIFACADTFGVPKWGLHKPTSVHFHDGLGRKTSSSVTCSGLFAHDNSYYIITAAHVMTRSPQPPDPSYDTALGESGSDSDDCEITGLDDWDSDTDDEMLSSVTSHGSITSSSAGSDNEERLAGRKSSHQSPPSVGTVPEETFEQVPETVEPSPAKEKGAAIHELCAPLGSVTFIDGELDLVLVRMWGRSPYDEVSLKRLPNVKPLDPQAYWDERFWDREGAAGSSATVLTASKGPISGKQLSMPFYTRLPGAHDFQMLHPFHLDIPLSAGDSGSWVVGGDDQELIGFVVSGSPKTGLCLVCPAKGAIRTFADRLYQRSVAPAAGPASSPPLGAGGVEPGTPSGWGPEESLDDYDWREAEAREVLGDDFPNFDLDHFDVEDDMDID